MCLWSTLKCNLSEGLLVTDSIKPHYVTSNVVDNFVMCYSDHPFHPFLTTGILLLAIWLWLLSQKAHMTSKDSDQTALKQHFETSNIAGILSCAIQIILLLYVFCPDYLTIGCMA